MQGNQQDGNSNNFSRVLPIDLSNLHVKWRIRGGARSIRCLSKSSACNLSTWKDVRVSLGIVSETLLYLRGVELATLGGLAPKC